MRKVKFCSDGKKVEEPKNILPDTGCDEVHKAEAGSIEDGQPLLFNKPLESQMSHLISEIDKLHNKINRLQLKLDSVPMLFGKACKVRCDSPKDAVIEAQFIEFCDNSQYAMIRSADGDIRQVSVYSLWFKDLDTAND